MLEVSHGGGVFARAGTHHSRHQQGIHVIGRCFQDLQNALAGVRDAVHEHLHPSQPHDHVRVMGRPLHAHFIQSQRLGAIAASFQGLRVEQDVVAVGLHRVAALIGVQSFRILILFLIGDRDLGAGFAGHRRIKQVLLPHRRFLGKSSQRSINVGKLVDINVILGKSLVKTQRLRERLLELLFRDQLLAMLHEFPRRVGGKTASCDRIHHGVQE